MKISFNKDEQKPQQIRFVIYALTALIISVANLVVLNFVEVAGLTPDLLLILVVWIAIVEGQFKGIFAGFAIGLLFDVISADVFGINALSKTLVAFIAGFFYRDGKHNQILGNFRFVLIVLSCSIAHNLVYYFFYIKLSQLDSFSFIWKYGLASTLYTTVVSVFPMLTKMRRKGI